MKATPTSRATRAYLRAISSQRSPVSGPVPVPQQQRTPERVLPPAGLVPVKLPSLALPQAPQRCALPKPSLQATAPKDSSGVPLLAVLFGLIAAAVVVSQCDGPQEENANRLARGCQP